MIFVNYEDCNGCGTCIEACEYDAIFLQNDKATIDQERCKGCQICMDACPSGAIVCTEEQSLPETIKIAAVPAPIEAIQEKMPSVGPFRSVVLPVLGSVLLWTGRELVPRLANLALKTLDQRILSTDQGVQRTIQSNMTMQGRRTSSPRSTSGGGRRRRLRQRRNRRNK
jgi:ferredoxin